MSGFDLAPAARDDLDEIHAYIAADNPQAADEVREAAFATFAILARTPGLGRVRHFKHSLLTGLRSFGVRPFSNYLVFYREREKRVEIVRVLHGARNLDAIFGDDREG